MGLEKSKIQKRVWLIFAVFLGVNLATIVYDLRTLRASLIEEKSTQTRYLVDSAYQVAAHFHRLSQQGYMTAGDAQAATRETLRAMRYGDHDYFWINDMGQPYPRMLMHPVMPELEGRVMDSPAFNTASRVRLGEDARIVATNGQENLFQAFVRVVSSAGYGYVYYDWTKPLANGQFDARNHAKVSFVRQYEPWGWVIGSGIYLDDVEQSVQERMLWHGFFSALLLLGLIGVTWYIIRGIRETEHQLLDSRAAMQALIDTT